MLESAQTLLEQELLDQQRQSFADLEISALCNCELAIREYNRRLRNRIVIQQRLGYQFND